MADRFIWYELITPDPDAAVRFYSAVLGWTSRDHQSPGAGDRRYLVVSAGGRDVGGIIGLTDEDCEGGATPGWLGYLRVPDTDSKTAQVAEAGGEVLMKPRDIPGVGRFSMVADADGAALCLLTPDGGEGGAEGADPIHRGGVGWTELYWRAGQQASFDFYAPLFGWDTIRIINMGGAGLYRIFGIGAEPLGGMMDKPPTVPEPTWIFYFDVDGLAAAIERVKANGGEMLMPAIPSPDGRWVTQALDPQGARFALVSKTR